MSQRGKKYSRMLQRGWMSVCDFNMVAPVIKVMPKWPSLETQVWITKD